MAGARARKLDLSGFLAGNSRTASIIANTDESGGIGGLLNGIAGGITRAGVNIREDKQRAEAKAEREKDRAFSQSLALKADARAEADQRMQEDEYRREVATGADAVLKVAEMQARLKASMASGMPPDPKIAEETGRYSSLIQKQGGPLAILARAKDVRLSPEEYASLTGQTRELEAFSEGFARYLPKLKGAAFNSANDSLIQIQSFLKSNRDVLRLHEATSKLDAEVAETRAKAEAEVAVKREEADRTRSDRIAEMMDAGFLKKPPVNAVGADAAWDRYQSQNKATGTAQGRESVAESKRVAKEARLRETYKAATGQYPPPGVEVEQLEEWESDRKAQAAVAEDRKASREIRERQAAETERHNRATEQLRALANNPNKDRLRAFADSAKLHLANAKEYNDPDSALGQTTGATAKAKAEIEAANKALADFDKLMRESGGAGTAPADKWESDPDYLALSEKGKAAWRAANGK